MYYRNAARVRVTQSIDLQPYTTLEEGETGTVQHVYHDAGHMWGLDILMDKPHKGLTTWDNEAHIAFEDLDNLTIVQSPLASAA